jgi:hypothetical protein
VSSLPNPLRKRRIERLPDAQDGMLRVPYATFEQAKRAFPNCERTALRAFTRSEASRIANRLIQPREMPEDFGEVVSIFFDLGAVKSASLRSRRFDAVLAMLKRGELEQTLARKLVREGKLSKAVLS